MCIILTSVLRRSLLTSRPLFFWGTVQVHLAVSHCCSFLLASTLCPAVQPNPFRKGLFFKADTAGYLQNDLFSASLSKLKIVCYIAMSPVTTGLHFLPSRALSHDCWLRCKQIFKRDFFKDCFQGADLAERWDSSFPYFLPNCCLDFSCDGWKSCSCIGQQCDVGDGYNCSSGCPPPALFQRERKIKFILLKL